MLFWSMQISEGDGVVPAPERVCTSEAGGVPALVETYEVGGGLVQL
jgi:hypothetical protein